MEFVYTDKAFVGELPYGQLNVGDGTSTGFRPNQLLVAAVAVCSCSVLRKTLIKQQAEIEEISVSTAIDRIKEEANRIDEIHLHFTIKGSNLNELQIGKAINVAFRNCPMAQSVKESIKLKETFEIV